ncbi:hypothetical protein Mfer_0619 [Methanothermus fervidus DSM 2088]|uniref:Uncharacterized protein n=1 Tax=Methanothermus fervidus (strain ATCC 43054 / DSM 2088 / JCM 10308 / V24 S) TaxID=523846 RepID=E3GYN6_METFV|nr:hypothetical protein [Methanothermus fervidus]ADP77418.1 hypothetical protein Mfer_0619 [Methanothermus fervidus DSM 2088]
MKRLTVAVPKKWRNRLIKVINLEHELCTKKKKLEILKKGEDALKIPCGWLSISQLVDYIVQQYVTRKDIDLDFFKTKNKDTLSLNGKLSITFNDDTYKKVQNFRKRLARKGRCISFAEVVRSAIKSWFESERPIYHLKKEIENVEKLIKKYESKKEKRMEMWHRP